MAYHHGRFVWFELLTSDIPAAAAFYGAIFDWDISGAADGSGAHQSIRHAGTEIGGIVPPPASGLGPEWLGYFSVPHVRRAAARAKAAGARPHSAPVKIPSIGEVAPMRDPSGGNFCFFRGASGDPRPTAGPGAWYWAELLAKEPAVSAAFYAEALGLRQTCPSVAAGEKGSADEAQLLLAQRAPVASVIRHPAEMPPGWLPYVHVRSLADVVSRGKSLGAKFPLGVIEGDAGRFAPMRDPLGAHLVVIEPI